MEKNILVEVDFAGLAPFRLCYVEGMAAYFTTQPVTEQWGDDWNDAPYEHNAGTPYAPSVHYYANGERKLSPRDWNPDGTPRYQLLRVLFELEHGHGELKAPCDFYGANSPYSVEAINAGAVAWLTAKRWNTEMKEYEVTGTLQAGATFAEFFEFIKAQEGVVYVPDTGLMPYPKPEPGLPFVEVK